MTVYLDSVFALNFAVNWLLLRAAARLGAAAVRPRRIAAAAALGAAYAVAVYLPGCGVLAGWAGKLAVTAALLAVAFGLRRETLRLAAVFGGVTLALCGAVYGLELLKHGRVRPGALWYPVTFSSLVLTAGGVYAATRLLLPRLSHAPDSVVPVRLTLGGRRVFLSALRDSGNTLCDPVTGEAVLVADWRCAARLLPHDGLRAADFAAPAALVLRLQRLHPRLIPFRAVGTGSGLLLALPCEEVRIGKSVQKNGLVAFSPTPVSDGGGYEALTGGKCEGGADPPAAGRRWRRDRAGPAHRAQSAARGLHRAPVREHRREHRGPDLHRDHRPHQGSRHVQIGPEHQAGNLCLALH